MPEKIGRRIATKKILQGTGAILGYNAFSLLERTDNYEYPTHVIRIKDLPNDLENAIIVQLSDLHIHDSFFTPLHSEEAAQNLRLEAEREVSKHQAKYKKKGPIIAVMTGDYVSVNQGGEHDETSSGLMIAALSELASIKSDMRFYVEGNHDKKYTENALLNQTIADLGFKSVEKISAEISDTPGFIISGLPSRLEEPGFYMDGAAEAYMKSLKYKLNILLAHNPDSIENGLNSLENSIALFGHTHGIQMRSWLVRRIIRETKDFKTKFDSGMYKEENGLYVNVSNGIGVSKNKPFRSNNPNIPLIVLKKA